MLRKGALVIEALCFILQQKNKNPFISCEDVPVKIAIHSVIAWALTFPFEEEMKMQDRTKGANDELSPVCGRLCLAMVK